MYIPTEFELKDRELILRWLSGYLPRERALMTQVWQEMNQQIAAAAEQQTAVAEEINRSVTSIRDIADQSATAMEETAASSIQLAELGRDLQGMAGHFRLT